jgi:hypothetical protein
MNLDHVRVQFQSKNPHNTLFVKVWADANNEPKEMYEALEKAGFEQEKVFPLPPIAAEAYYDAGYPRGDKTPTITRYFCKSGNGLFGGWTPAEKKVNLPAARGVLRKFGFIRVTHRKLTLEDML